MLALTQTASLIKRPRRIWVYYSHNTVTCKSSSSHHSLIVSVAVDIYHITPAHPRFASVAYTDPASGLAAIEDLSRKPINLDTPFAREQYDDLDVWRTWNGQLTVVLAEPPRLVPTSVAADFPDLPDWALGIKDGRSDEADKMEVDAQVKQERDSSPESAGRKRDRQASHPVVQQS
jgi:hypothetical protein